MLPLIQDKAWQPAPSNVRTTEASKQYDYTTHMKKIKIAHSVETDQFYGYNVKSELNKFPIPNELLIILTTPAFSFSFMKKTNIYIYIKMSQNIYPGLHPFSQMAQIDHKAISFEICITAVTGRIWGRSMNPGKLFFSPSSLSLLSIQFLLCSREWIEKP